VHLEQIAFNFNDSITAREKKNERDRKRERERKSEKKTTTELDNGQ
jgi:hypothetical protein